MSLSIAGFTSYGAQFESNATFQSTDDFVTAAKAFKPEASKTDLSKYFTILEEKGVTPPATAESINSCEVIFENDREAIVFATAQPPTDYTYWKIGILFYLLSDGSHWRIADIHRFDAQNKEANIECELTSGEQSETIVTVTVARGRREWYYTESASYSPSGNRLVRRDPEKSE